MPRVTRWRLLTVWLVVFTVLAAFAIGQNRMLGEQGQEAHDALCVFKVDLERRADDGQALLEMNPSAPNIFGIPRTVIEQSVSNQRKTIDSLEDLDCPIQGGTP